MKQQIVIRFSLPGLHCWPDAVRILPKVGYLAHVHRHEFFFEIKKEVSHDDRQIEIIDFSDEVKNYLHRNYFKKELNILDFQNMSCEAIARDLQEAFDLDFCQVLEDNLMGAVIVK